MQQQQQRRRRRPKAGSSSSGGGGGGIRRTLVAYTKRIRACKVRWKGDDLWCVWTYFCFSPLLTPTALQSVHEHLLSLSPYLTRYHPNNTLQPSEWRQALRILQELDGDRPPSPAAAAALGRKSSSSHSSNNPPSARAGVVKPDLVLMNVAMDVVAKAGRWQECLSLLRSLPSRGLKPDIVSFNTAVHACARAGRVEGAMGLACGMAAAGVPPNARTVGAVLDACRRAGQWEAAVAVLGQMEGGGIYGHVAPGVVHYSVVIDACLAAGRAEEAAALLREMTGVRGLRPDVQVYTSVAREEGRMGRGGRVTALVGEMEGEGGVVPDERFFAAVLEGAARGVKDAAEQEQQGFVGVVREALSLLKARGLPPSLVAHTAAVRALVGAGRPREAWQLFRKARAVHGGRMDLRLYTAGLTALAKEGRVVEAKALVAELEMAAVRPDAVCHALVMEACCRAGRYGEAMATVLRGPLRFVK